MSRLKRPLIRLFFFLPAIVFFLFLLIVFINPSFYAKRDFLSLRLSTDPKSFNPILAKETSTTAITSFLFLGLLSKDPETKQMRPELARSWQVLDNGLRYRFHLKKGLKWSDGEPITADDVVFTFNDLIYNPDIPNSASQVFLINGRPIEVKKIDDLTVDFLLPDIFAPFLKAMSQEIMPDHALRRFVENKSFNSAWGLASDEKDIVCSGPYIIDCYEPGQFVELKANKYYYKKGLPKIKRLRMRIIQSDDVALLKFLEGEIDIISIRPCDFYFVKSRAGKRDFSIIELGAGTGSTFITFNQNPSARIDKYKRDWFSDLRFRKAVAYAIDRKGIIDTVFCGLGLPQYGPMSEAEGFFFFSDVQKYPYSIERAISLLEEMGFSDSNKDGILEDNQGRQLEFTLITNSNSQERVRVGSIIATDLKKIGMMVHFAPIDFNNLVSRLTGSYDWEAVLIGLTGGEEPHFGANVWLSNGPLHLWNPLQSGPASAYEKEIDEIFSKAVRELDRDKRKLLYDKWQRIVSENLPVIYTVLPMQIYGINNRVKNIKPLKDMGVLYNIEELELE